MNLRLSFYRIVIRGEKKVAKKRPVFFAFGLLQKREERERPRSPDERKAAKKKSSFLSIANGPKGWTRGAFVCAPPLLLFLQKSVFSSVSVVRAQKGLKVQVGLRLSALPARSAERSSGNPCCCRNQIYCCVRCCWCWCCGQTFFVFNPLVRLCTAWAFPTTNLVVATWNSLCHQVIKLNKLVSKLSF